MEDNNGFVKKLCEPNLPTPFLEENESNSSANQSLAQIFEEDDPKNFGNSNEVKNVHLSFIVILSSTITDEQIFTAYIPQRTLNSYGRSFITRYSPTIGDKINYNIYCNSTNGSNISTRIISYFEEDIIHVLSDIKLSLDYLNETKIQVGPFHSSNLFHSKLSTVFSNKVNLTIYEVKEDVELKSVNGFKTNNKVNLTFSDLKYKIVHFISETESLKISIWYPNEPLVIIQELKLPYKNILKLDKSTQQLNISLEDIKEEGLTLDTENENVQERAFPYFAQIKIDSKNLNREKGISTRITALKEQVSAALNHNKVCSPKQQQERDKYSLKVTGPKLDKRPLTVLQDLICISLNKDITKILECIEATVDSWWFFNKHQHIADIVMVFYKLLHTISYIYLFVEERIVLVFNKFQHLFLQVKGTNECILEKCNRSYTENSVSINLLLSLNNEISKLTTNVKELTVANKLLNERLHEVESKARCSTKALKELEGLKNTLISEITHLDTDEREEYLSNSTSEKLFNKLRLIIIRKQEEVSAYQETFFKLETDKLQESNKLLRNTLNSHKYWIEELENDYDRTTKELLKANETNREFQDKIKNLTCSLKCTMDQVSLLKKECLKLTSDNDILRIELDKSKKLNENERKYKHSGTCYGEVFHMNNLKYKNDNHEVFQDFIESCCEECDKLNTDCEINYLSSFELSNGSLYGSYKMDNNFNKDLYNEKSRFINELNSINVEFNSIKFPSCESFVFFKDIVELVQDKLFHIQNHFTSKVQQLKNDLNIKAYELTNAKKIIDDFYQDALEIKEKWLSCLPDSGDKFLLDCGDSKYSSLEIGLMKDDCFVINDVATSFKSRFEGGQYIIKQLSKQMEIIQRLVFQKDELICNLNQTIENEGKLSEIRLRKLIEIEEENTLLKADKIRLEHKDRDISKLKLILTQLHCGVLGEYSDLNKTSEIVQEIFAYYVKLDEDCRFFSTQCIFMIDYIMNLSSEFDHLNDCVMESNIFMNHIKKYVLFSKAQFGEMTMHEILNGLSKIFSEHSWLKVNQVKNLEELKSTQYQLSKTQKELKSSQKINSNLTFELNSTQNVIRNLHSEIQKLRRQARNKANKNSFNVIKERKDIGVQTDCSSYNQKRPIADLKHSLAKSNFKSTCLELQIKNEDQPLVKRAKLCEISLTQAKDRIRSLRMELADQKLHNQELIQQINVLKTHSDQPST